MTEKPVDLPEEMGPPAANAPVSPTRSPVAGDTDAPTQRAAAYGAAAWTQAHPEGMGGLEATPPHSSAAPAAAPSAAPLEEPAGAPPQRAPAYGAAAWTQAHPQTGAASGAALSEHMPDATSPARPPADPPTGPAAAPRYEKSSESAWTVLGRIVNARARSVFDRAGQRLTQRTLKIGVSARIFHPEPGAKGLRGKTLQYLEESISHWVMSRDVLVFMVPTVGQRGMLHPSNIRLRDYAKHLDALVLQGGADVSPQSFAGSPDAPVTQPEWPGDRVRDMYELELLHEFIESGKPVLGICRGCQLINVAFGGTLYQDIATDVPSAGIHVNDQYDRLNHAIRFPADSTLMGMFGGREHALVNSIHHQAVSQLGRDLRVEAVSEGDGIVEAIRYRKAPFVVGVQWHPEFHHPDGTGLLDCSPLLDHFLRAARETRL
ncbi:gamma-glutamyl-gamma-aminobutyrate hydrolase family protein [Robbsia sp. Bb-Pol-6]|uniref:Gamma-glutamyl-gamma-aminobutyrate hydrolase family protein n=1 Tax=Robbsia betulipollinis TaxID=2981849 RepID=A0ABT3ZRU4_9BURK|nr:gamma-glutamyl-gamma-aminobutyrate hydrolase family protein [Robbsia betulipollinis]MCY0388655.1 gamma-glutamyl-gamma-aminobutyrate hydrolase family protein [Robbsia betulipollinis]